MQTYGVQRDLFLQVIHIVGIFLGFDVYINVCMLVSKVGMFSTVTFMWPLNAFLGRYPKLQVTLEHL